MSDRLERIGVVGASAAGLAVVQSLREEGFDGEIILVDAEDRPFYDRPPLSKIWPLGERASIALAGEDDIAALRLSLRLGVAATGLEATRRRILLDTGESLLCDAIVIASGASPLRLHGGGHTLRTYDDAVAIGSALADAQSVIVIGAGVLGCELAALASTRGKATRMIDPLGGPMIDRFGPQVAGRLARLHTAHGVELLPNALVEAVVDGGNGETTVRLKDGRTLTADLVLVAVGARPATNWLENSSLNLSNGVVCDEFCTAAPGIYAAGDVCNWFNPRFRRHMRIEHRMNATEQGMAVAANILREPIPFDPIPFFWSDQYDVKLQVHGLIRGGAKIQPIAGSIQDGNFVVAFVDDAVVQGVLGWNMPKETRKARSLVGLPLQ